MRLLVQAGARLELDSNTGETILIAASRRGLVEAIRLLVREAIVSIDAVDSEGRTALMHATMNSRVEIVRFLKNSGASLNISDVYGESAATMALDLSDMEVFSILNPPCTLL